MKTLKSKYSELDIENMSDEEFSKIARKVYISAAVRSLGGMLLFVVCIVVFILCSRYGW